MTVIITCGETRQSLCATRSLGRAGIPVAVVAARRPCLSMWSRFATSTFLSEPSDKKPYRFVEHLAEELKGRYSTCALVSTNSAWWALSAYRELLPINARRILPPHYSVVRSLDHEALHHFAESLGIPVAPLIRLPKGLEALDVDSYLENVSYPFLLRPARAWLEHEDQKSILPPPLVVKSAKHLHKLQSDDAPIFKRDCLVSAYKSESTISYFGVADKGEVIVEGFQQRLRELEPFNEIATQSITISPVPRVRKYAKSLLRALSWQGPFKVEFIKVQSGELQLVTLIGRLWGSLQLALSAGVNIPLICYRMAEGTITKDILRNAKPNVRMRWLIGDAASKLGNVTQLLGNIASVGRFISPRLLSPKLLQRSRVKTCYDVLDFEDPMPFLFELQHRTWRRMFS